MAKLHKIALSKEEGAKKNELIILTSILEKAYTKASMKNQRELFDLFEDLQKADEQVLVTAGTVGLLKQAHDDLAKEGQKPIGWIQYRKLLEQLEAPEEVEVS